MMPSTSTPCRGPRCSVRSLVATVLLCGCEVPIAIIPHQGSKGQKLGHESLHRATTLLFVRLVLGVGGSGHGHQTVVVIQQLIAERTPAHRLDSFGLHSSPTCREAACLASFRVS